MTAGELPGEREWRHSDKTPQNQDTPLIRTLTVLISVLIRGCPPQHCVPPAHGREEKSESVSEVSLLPRQFIMEEVRDTRLARQQ